MASDPRLPADAVAARERQDYSTALKLLDREIYPMRLHDNAEGAEALAREASRIAEATTGRTHKRALDVASKATAAAGQIRQNLGREAILAALPGSAPAAAVEKDVSPVALAIALVGAGVMLISVFLPRVESNTFLRVAQNTMIQSGGGWYFIGLAVATAVAAYYAYQRRGGGAGTMVFGLIAIAVAVYYGTNKGSLTLCPVDQSSATTLGLGCSKANPGVGIYAAGVGGLLAAIGGWQIWRSETIEADDVADDDEDEASAEDVEQTAGDIETRLRRLDSLKEGGLLTDEEYAQRRASILDSI